MEAVIEFLTTAPFWYWWVLAVGLLVIELGTGSTYFLWPAAAAVVTGFADIWPLDEQWRLQLALFAVITVLLAVFATPRAKAWIQSSQTDHHDLNERGAQKIGRRVLVDETFSNGLGRVRLGDSVWSAESENREDFEAGESVEITRTEGAKLFVKAAS